MPRVIKLVKSKSGDANCVSRYFFAKGSIAGQSDNGIDVSLNQFGTENFHEGGITGEEFLKIKQSLSSFDETADKIRIGYLSLVDALDNLILEFHATGVYPDPSQGTNSYFTLKDNILAIMKNILVTKGELKLNIHVIPTPLPWRDSVVTSFCKDLKEILRVKKFISIWDGIECYEFSKLMLSQAFILLEKSGNFGDRKKI